jgi:hypothetical protein
VVFFLSVTGTLMGMILTPQKVNQRRSANVDFRCSASTTKGKENGMRFLVIVKTSKDYEAGKMPSHEELPKWAVSTKSWQTPV